VRILPKLDGYTRSLVTKPDATFHRSVVVVQRPVDLASLPAGFENARVWRATINTRAHADTPSIFAFFNLDNKSRDPCAATWKELGLDDKRHAVQNTFTMDTSKVSKDVSVTLPAHGSTVVEVQLE